MPYILLQATAAAPAAQGGFGGSTMIFMVAMFAILYFLMIRPQQKRAKELQKMLESLQVNDKVLTSSGIYGRVVSLKPDKGIVVVEIDETNKVRVEFQKSAIVTILNIVDTATAK
ncbi:preprotein translocase subunit YajC [Candidatus Cloacimonadota bacterium]|jgi:preprotein translocase subunit YajC|nr:preprotein translocase subunit YajC [Candidatus Cloacimonadota bacterium]MDD3235788.1 preprotein translocase subunit YajC [Candidatus Cloacimonadota bacterium]